MFARFCRTRCSGQGFKVFKVFIELWPGGGGGGGGRESEVTFAHDIPYEQVHEFC